jgi:hypothetical protein
MTWRKVQGGLNSYPYKVRWTPGGKWIARCDTGTGLPAHLGTFAPEKEARAACEDHRTAGRNGWQSSDLIYEATNHGWAEK